MSQEDGFKTRDELASDIETPNPFSDCKNLEEVIALNKSQVERLIQEMRFALWGTNNELLLDRLLNFANKVDTLTAITLEQQTYLTKYFTKPLSEDKRLRYDLDNFPPTAIEYHRFLYAKNNPDILESLKEISGFNE